MKYTQIIYVKTTHNSTIPLLIVKDKISLLSLKYIRELELRGKSLSTLYKITQSIAYMWDFYLTFEEQFKNHKNTSDVLKKYAELRLKGTVNSFGNDETLLFWKSVKLNTVKLDIYNLTEYSQYLEYNFDAESLNPLEKKFKNDIEYIVKKSIQNKHSFLNHIKQKENSVKIKTFDRKDNYGKHNKTNYKAFPYSKIESLIKMSNLREKLIYILLAYGGCRGSELLHIMLNDISLNEKNGTANVMLVNPVEGYIEWTKNGINKKGMRKEFLLDKFNLEPRNLMKNKYYSGWKSMTEDDGLHHISYVYWTNPEMGKLFYKLHLEYMDLRLKTTKNHPFYFISLSEKEFGNPLTLNALKNKFKNDILKIGLSLNDSGVSLHGLRHFYGYYCANQLKISKEVTQRMMHHRSISSTEVYYQKKGLFFG